jgi:ferritin-like metal-binding protein YciE
MSTHPSVERFKDLFEEELETLYFAESQLLKALPLVKKGVFNKELAHALVQQTAQTKIYVKSLKSTLNHLGRRVSITRNATSEAMLSELTHLVNRFPRGFDSVSAKRFAQIALQVNAEAFIDTHSERCPPAVPPLT